MRRLILNLRLATALVADAFILVLGAYHLRLLTGDSLNSDLQLESVNDSRTVKVSQTRVRGD